MRNTSSKHSQTYTGDSRNIAFPSGNKNSGLHEDEAVTSNSEHIEAAIEKLMAHGESIALTNGQSKSSHAKGRGEVHEVLENIFLTYEEAEWGDDDEDDEDWEPNIHWSCRNCTMLNPDKLIHCRLCREHRESGIVNSGFLAAADLPEKKVILKPYTDGHEEGFQHLAVSPSRIALPVGEKLTAIGYDARMLLHEQTCAKSSPHPERPDRLRSIMAGLAASGLFPGRCFGIPPREITRKELDNVHTPEHIDAVETSSERDSTNFTSDTYANRNSALVARLAAGICADMATLIMKGKAANGFALVRPPGHHAEGSNVMGFCLYNNVALAAKAALKAGAKRVLILDWDVHHGNGTQEIFYRDSSVLYVSLHRHEGGQFYPGTGSAREVGSGVGMGFSVNIPWPCGGIGDADYVFAFQQVVLPIAAQYAPDITIISAGFDAAKGDPLGCCEVTPNGYGYMTHMLKLLTNGKVMLALEGGYNLRSISSSVATVIKVLLDDNPGQFSEKIQARPSPYGLAAVAETIGAHASFWMGLKMPVLKMKYHFVDRRKLRRGKLKKVVGGPVWWKWGRKKLVYQQWFSSPRFL